MGTFFSFTGNDSRDHLPIQIVAGREPTKSNQIKRGNAWAGWKSMETATNSILGSRNKKGLTKKTTDRSSKDVRLYNTFDILSLFRF